MLLLKGKKSVPFFRCGKFWRGEKNDSTMIPKARVKLSMNRTTEANEDQNTVATADRLSGGEEEKK